MVQQIEPRSTRISLDRPSKSWPFVANSLGQLHYATMISVQCGPAASPAKMWGSGSMMRGTASRLQAVCLPCLLFCLCGQTTSILLLPSTTYLTCFSPIQKLKYSKALLIQVRYAQRVTKTYDDHRFDYKYLIDVQPC